MIEYNDSNHNNIIKSTDFDVCNQRNFILRRPQTLSKRLAMNIKHFQACRQIFMYGEGILTSRKSNIYIIKNV